MNILVIAPHPDDEAIGCGGTLRLHADRGDRLAVVFLSSGELGLPHLPPDEARRTREREAEAAAEILGITALSFLRQPDWFVGEHLDQAAGLLAPIVERQAPEVIYLPHPGEWHPDHQAALAIARASLQRAGLAGTTLLSYEVWTPLAEHDQVEDISSVIEHKLRAIRCYESQLGHFRYDRAVEGLNQYRGALAARCDYAEVFLFTSAEHPDALGGRTESGSEARPTSESVVP